MTSPISQRLDCLPVNALHVAIVAVCALSLSVDTLDIAIGNALATVFSSPPYSVQPQPLAWMLASIFMGAVVGAPSLGRMADRRGMRAVLMLAMLWLGLTTLLTAASADMRWLFTLRLLSGISIGALPPLLIAYLTGLSPARYRGLFVFWVCAIAYLAPPITLFTMRWLAHQQPLGLEGWRWPFLVSGGFAVLIGIGFRTLPESPGWLLTVGRAVEAEGVLQRFETSRRLLGQPLEIPDPDLPGPQVSSPLGEQTHSSASKPRFILVAVLYFLLGWVAVGFPLLTGPVLIERGYDLAGALLFVALTQVGPSLSTLATGLVIDKLPRRTALALFAACMLAAIALFFASSTPRMLGASVVGYGIAAALYVPVLTTYTAEIFPTAIRSSATAVAWAINRVSSFLAPLVLLPMLHRSGSTAVALVLSAVLVAMILVVVWRGPEGLAGRPVT